MTIAPVTGVQPAPYPYLLPPTASPTAQHVQAYHADGVQNGVSRDSALTKAVVGGLVGYKYNKGTLGAEGVPNFKQGLITGIGIGMAVSGGVSLVKNLNALTHGRVSSSLAATNVLSDTIQGAVSGLGGLAGGGISALALKALGVAGTPLIIVGVIGGSIGAVLTNKLFNTEKLRVVLQGAR